MKKNAALIVILGGVLINIVALGLGLLTLFPLCCLPVTLLIPFWGAYEYFKE
jgi:hypothetical protein